jgi:hypothetical protein
MSEQPSLSTAMPWWKRLGEDWWSVIIGLVLIALVYVGVLGSVPW